MFKVMILLVTPVLVGVLVGAAAGGRLANLLSVRLRALWLRRLVQDDGRARCSWQPR